MNSIIILSDSGFTRADLGPRVLELTKATIPRPVDDDSSPVVYGVTRNGSETTDFTALLVVGSDEGITYVNSTEGCLLKVVSLSYKKSVVEPGQMIVKMTINEVKDKVLPSRDDMISFLKLNVGAAYVSFLGYSGDYLKKINDKMEVKQAKDLVGSVTNYYIHNFKLNYKPDHKEVTLYCYSPEYKLKFDIGSSVFSGKAFATDVFNTVVARHITINDKSTWGLNNGVSRLNYLKYYDGSTSKTREVLQPFLVQYNESSYDFLRRTAQRCGEFFYYDQNEICVGLPSDTLQNTNAVEIDPNKVKINYDEVDIVTGLDSEVSCFTSSYDSASGAVKNELKYVPAFTDNPYFTQLDAEHGKVIFDMMMDFEIFLYESYTSFARGTSTGSAIMGFVDTFVQDMVEASIDQNVLSGKFNDTVSKYCGNVGIDNDRKGKGVSAVLLNAFYYYVEKAESLAEKGMVSVDYLDKTPDLCLGKNVSLKDKTAEFYIVSEMEGSIDAVERSYNVKLVPVFKASDTQNNNGMKSTYIAVPPKNNVEFIRESKPQEGIVTDFKDPMQLGRVRVRFAWQAESEPSSPWIRVAVPYAGDGHGMVMTPDVNDRMMLNFIGGNVECPYVAGYLYCADKRLPTGAGLLKDRMNPDFSRKIISSATGQSITFVDKPDKSSLINMVVPPVAAVWNLVNSFASSSATPEDVLPFAPFNGELILRDDNGVYELNLSAKTRNITVKSAFGNVILDAFTGITISAPNGDINIEGKNVNIKAGNNITMVSGSNIKDKEMDLTEFSIMSINSVLNSLVGAAAKALTTRFTGFRSFKKNISDLTFLRSSWEVLMRPVEGSLKLHSNRNTLITAGKGKAMVPVSLMSTAKIGISDNTIGGMAKDSYATNEFVLMVKLLKEVDEYLNLYNEQLLFAFETIKNEEIKANNSFYTLITEYVKKEIYNKYFGNGQSDKELLLNKLITMLMNQEKITEVLSQKDIKNIKGRNRDHRWIVAVGHLNLAKKFHDNCISNISTYFNFQSLNAVFNRRLQDITNKYSQLGIRYVNINDCAQYFQIDISKKADIENYLKNGTFTNENINKLRKKVFKHFLGNILSGKISHPSGDLWNDNTVINGSNSDWTKMVNALNVVSSPVSEGAVAAQLLGSAIDTLTFGLTSVASDGFTKQAIGGDLKKNIKRTFNINGEAGPRSVWDTAAGGSILLSNTPGVTYKLNRSSAGWERVANPGLMTLKAYLGEAFGIGPSIKEYLPINFK